MKGSEEVALGELGYQELIAVEGEEQFFEIRYLCNNYKIGSGFLLHPLV